MLDTQIMVFLTVVGGGLLIVLAVGWIILPFALIGTKPLLRRILEELVEQNRRADRSSPRTEGLSEPQPSDGRRAAPHRGPDMHERQRNLSGLPPV